MKKVTIGLLVGGFVLVTSIGLATWASLPNADSDKATTALAKSAVGQTSTPLFLSTTQTPADTLPWTGTGVRPRRRATRGR